jgi:hypothetical protein
MSLVSQNWQPGGADKNLDYLEVAVAVKVVVA